MKGTRRKLPKARPEDIYDTTEFDSEFVAETFHPMTRDQQAMWKKAKKKPGRPKHGEGARVISLSVENGLLKRADKLAKELGITRARLFARGLRAVLAAEGQG
jgi:hypothetical protein